MGRVPSPPTDVQFTAASAGLITASWTVNDCRDNPNCVMTHGYVATCCMPGSEISTTVWQSDMESVDPIRVEITGVNPATRYVCKVAAFNAYGVGNTGSNIFVSTPEAGMHEANYGGIIVMPVHCFLCVLKTVGKSFDMFTHTHTHTQLNNAFTMHRQLSTRVLYSY